MRKTLYKLTFTIGLFFTTTLCLSQKDSLKEARIDFCENAIFEYNYGTDAFRGLMNLALKSKGATTYEDMIMGLEELCEDYALQDEFFRMLYSISAENREILFGQFRSIGLKTKNISELVDYVIEVNEDKRHYNEDN